MRITYDTQQYPTVFVKIVNGVDEYNTLYESFMTFNRYRFLDRIMEKLLEKSLWTSLGEVMVKFY